MAIAEREPAPSVFMSPSLSLLAMHQKTSASERAVSALSAKSVEDEASFECEEIIEKSAAEREVEDSGCLV